MKKLSLILIIYVFLLASFVPMTAAQDYDLPACTEDELSAVAEAIAIYSEGIASLDEISTDANDAVYGAVVVGYDAFSYAFWSEVYPEFPECAEAQIIGFTVGIAYDELTIGAAYANIAGWAIAAEDAESAEYFAEAALERVEEVEELFIALDELTTEDLLGALPACTAEEYEASTAALETYGEELDAVFTDITMGADSEIEAAVATLITIDAAAIVYWDELYPELPACAEAEYEALLMGLALDELVLISSLGVNVMLEEAGGNSEIAAELLASTEVRFNDLMQMMSEAMQ